MKKSIGNAIALYPTPLVVVGAMVNGKPDWVLAGHLGIMGHDRIMISLAQAHYTNIGIRAQKALSVNIVDKALLPRADYVGSVSGSKTDKSGVFGWHTEADGAPLIDDAPISAAINEAVELTRKYENEDVVSFVNGILGGFAREVQQSC